jgi:hypothetical protein
MRVLMLVAAFFLAVPQARALRAIPDDNLAYPVLISLKSGNGGSGFFFNGRSSIYLVTAKHVLLDMARPEQPLLSNEGELVSYSRDAGEKKQNRFSINLATLDKAGHVIRHPTRDVIAVRLGSLTHRDGADKITPLNGITAQSVAPLGVVGVPIENVARFDEVLVSNNVFVFGYPTSLGLKALPQFDLKRPLLRRGIVAGLNLDQRSIVLDCPVYPGNSGGPVLEEDDESPGNRRFRVIGVIAEFVPAVETWLNVGHNYNNVTINNSGYSIATPMDFVLELLGKDAQPPAPRDQPLPSGSIQP